MEIFLHSCEPLNEDEIRQLVLEEPELAVLLILEQDRRLREKIDYSPEMYAPSIRRLEGRLVDLALIESTDADVRRLAKRLHKYWDELLTFLKKPHIPPTNNHAEREVRPAVIMRKIMQGNRTD